MKGYRAFHGAFRAFMTLNDLRFSIDMISRQDDCYSPRFREKRREMYFTVDFDERSRLLRLPLSMPWSAAHAVKYSPPMPHTAISADSDDGFRDCALARYHSEHFRHEITRAGAEDLS